MINNIGLKRICLCLLTILSVSSCQLAHGNHGHIIGEISKTDNREEVHYASNDDTKFDERLLKQSLPTGVASQIMHKKGYIVSYNRDTKIPNWVAWHLTAAHVDGPHNRKGIKFHEDDEAEGVKVTTGDYARSGYDRGHMCPSGDNKWNEMAQYDSFLMTNMCPQNGGLNRGDWNEMEIQCRKWAVEYGDIYIVAGPILYKGNHKTIGKAHVTVPEAFFKVVLCMNGIPRAVGFIYKNENGNRPKNSYQNTVDQVERITGIDFFPSLPDNIEKKVESKIGISVH